MQNCKGDAKDIKQYQFGRRLRIIKLANITEYFASQQGTHE